MVGGIELTANFLGAWKIIEPRRCGNGGSIIRKARCPAGAKNLVTTVPTKEPSDTLEAGPSGPQDSICLLVGGEALSNRRPCAWSSRNELA